MGAHYPAMQLQHQIMCNWRTPFNFVPNHRFFVNYFIGDYVLFYRYGLRRQQDLLIEAIHKISFCMLLI
jgi:hypothetical protein